MIVPEATNMPPTPWQTETIAIARAFIFVVPAQAGT